MTFNNPTTPVSLDALAVGRSSTAQFITVFQARSPTTGDVNYPIQQRWFNTTNNTEWILVGYNISGEIKTAIWEPISSGALSNETLTGNTGGPVGVDGSNNINVVGDGTTATVVGNPGTHTLTISVLAAPGELETLTGNTGGPVSPLAGNINVVGDGTTANVVGNPATHTLTISAITGPSVTETLTGNSGGAVGVDGSNNINVVGDGTTINIVGNPGTHTLTASTTGAVATSYVEDTGTAVPVGGILNVKGGTGITTSGSGDTITISATSSTPLTFTENTGTATPSGNNINILGTNGLTTSGSGSTVTITSTNGQIMTGVIPDAHTAPGTSPVVPNSSGDITITGGQVPAGTTVNVIRTDSLAANTYTIQVQRSQAVASSTIGANGVSHFNNTQFSVDANGFTSIIAGSGFTSINVQTFTSSGTYTPTAGMAYCIIECVAGGGGGGGAASATAGFTCTSGGGGGGGYARLTASAATIGASQVVTVGAGGAGGLAGNNTGGTGGSTSVGTLCVATGGIGGGGSSGSTPGIGGFYGYGSAGDLILTGDGGQTGILCPTTTVTGCPGGGGSFFRGGALQTLIVGSTGTSPSGTVYGGGGGAAWSTNGGGAIAALQGGPGIVYITEFII